MSLATRCTSCGTAFRVVQDQLKVSEGWVRCGRCSEVFNALEGLFDLERETPSEWPQAPGSELSAATAAAASDREDHGDGDDGRHPPDPASLYKDVDDAIEPAAASEPTAPVVPDPDVATDEWAVAAAAERESSIDEQIDAHLFGVRRAARRRAPTAHVNERDRLDFSDARFDSDLLADEPALDDALDPAGPMRPDELPLEVRAAPEFLRRAESRARWQRPIVRAGLAFAALMLSASLVLQAGHHFRDLASAHWPELKPALAQWCVIASCTLEAPRRIEDISVESTALTQAAGNEAFHLAVTLRSRSNMPLATPWVDLSLTDASGKLVARKALSAQAFKPVTTVLQPGAEVALQTLLGTRGARVTGYTVEIFYP